MIDLEAVHFPQNVINLLSDLIPTRLDSRLNVFRRALRTTDPNLSIGFVAAQWTPDEESYEIGGAPSYLGGAGRGGATILRYQVAIQAYVRVMDEQEGLAQHSAMASAIRAMLLTDPELGVAFGALRADAGVTGTEKFLRCKISSQRYASNELDGKWLYMSVTELIIETETKW